MFWLLVNVRRIPNRSRETVKGALNLTLIGHVPVLFFHNTSSATFNFASALHQSMVFKLVILTSYVYAVVPLRKNGMINASWLSSSMPNDFPLCVTVTRKVVN